MSVCRCLSVCIARRGMYLWRRGGGTKKREPLQKGRDCLPSRPIPTSADTVFDNIAPPAHFLLDAVCVLYYNSRDFERVTAVAWIQYSYFKPNRKKDRDFCARCAVFFLQFSCQNCTYYTCSNEPQFNSL